MKYPSNKQDSSSNPQRNKNVAKNPHASSANKSKSVKIDRNLIQQQRTNMPLSKSKKQNRAKKHTVHADQESPNNQNGLIGHDDQNQAFDAHQHIKANKSGQSKPGSRTNKQYDDLLQVSGKGFKRQKNLYFLQNQKYQGKGKNQESSEQMQEQNEQEFDDAQQQNIQQQQSDELGSNDQNNQDFEENKEQFEESQSMDSLQQQQNENQIKKALSLLKQKRQSTSKLLNEQILSINQEDTMHLKDIKTKKSKTTEQQMQQALQLKKLLEVYDRLVQLRYGQQKELQEIKQYPKMNQQLDQPQYPPLNHQLFTSSRQLQNEMISDLSKYHQLYQKLATKCNFKIKKSNLKANDSDNDSEQQLIETQQKASQETVDLQALIQADNAENNDQDTSSPKRLNADKVYTYIKESISGSVSEVQKQLVKWSQKTSFLSSNTSSSQLNSLLMQTPVGQAKKVLSNWQRMAHKCQQKRGHQPFKILFEDDENIHELSDKQIYDDYDLFIELEKYYLEKLDNQNEDGEFLQSATMKYLKNRQANQLQHEKKQKDVDRKASKNRKIRYNVHAKLLNFMPSCQQNVIQTRDQIVKNMFNCNATSNQEGMQGNASKHRAAQHFQEVDLIQVE